MVYLWKNLEIKFAGIRGWIRKYRLVYNLIVFKYSQGSFQHNIMVSESLTVILSLYIRLKTNFGKVRKMACEKYFFS